jgi:hypothetical protein
MFSSCSATERRRERSESKNENLLNDDDSAEFDSISLVEHRNQPRRFHGATQNFNKHFLRSAGLKLKWKLKGAKVRNKSRALRELDSSPWSIHLVYNSSSWLQRFTHHRRDDPPQSVSSENPVNQASCSVTIASGFPVIFNSFSQIGHFNTNHI